MKSNVGNLQNAVSHSGDRCIYTVETVAERSFLTVPLSSTELEACAIYVRLY